jgi:hypothetical protein
MSAGAFVALARKRNDARFPGIPSPTGCTKFLVARAPKRKVCCSLKATHLSHFVWVVEPTETDCSGRRNRICAQARLHRGLKPFHVHLSKRLIFEGQHNSGDSKPLIKDWEDGRSFLRLYEGSMASGPFPLNLVLGA